jgi:FAD synthetase
MSLKIRETLQRFDAFYHGSDTQIRERLQQALDVIDRSIDIFSLEGVCFSFNGGKDSTVILYLLLIVIAKKLLEEKKIAVDKTKNEGTTVTSPRNNFVEPALIPEKELEAKVLEHVKRIPVMYFDSHDQFPEVRQFIETCVQR